MVRRKALTTNPQTGAHLTLTKALSTFTFNRQASTRAHLIIFACAVSGGVHAVLAPARGLVPRAGRHALEARKLLRGKKVGSAGRKVGMSNRSIRDHTTYRASPDFVGWRESRLRQAGFEAARASELARDGRVDFHSLLDLIDRGCPPDLAERIVAPLDGDST
jgi:hypothetical protein